ncbi:MAG: SMC-Scp complex subunit ScpB [Candidatus Kerfeldbacteria bacterium]|nr:SMC-Scp complex subunit ScpB [Candidatus Kerfeldbacteria bacterium]
MELRYLIESLLFISGKPLSAQKLGEILKEKTEDITVAAEALMAEYNTADRGIHVQKVGQSYQMATSPKYSTVIKEFIKSEQTGELTKPALESLTIIAYRGPITKAELEQIRGVNCSLILRNLMIRGLIEAHDDKEKMATVYTITFDFLQFLGIDRVSQLPDYGKLNSDENLRKLLQEKMTNQTEAVSE